jgi:hypothetical protein
MTSTVKIEFKAEDYALLQSYQRQLKEQDKVIQKLKDTKTAVKDVEKGHEDSGRTGSNALTSYAAKTLSVVAATKVILDGVNAWRQANSELLKDADQIADKYDDLQRKFRVQSGLRGIGAEEAQTRINAIAISTATPVDKAYEAATSMVSAGFSEKEASSESLRNFLNVLSASNLRGKSPTDAGELATSLSSYLDANRMDKNAENVLKIGARIQGLSETNVTFAAMKDLAKVSAGFRDQLKTEEQIAAFASLTYVMPSESAAVSMAEMTKNLSIAKTQPNRVQALKAMGMTPADIDFQGEDFMTVMARLQKGFDSVPAEDAQGYKALLVEGANIKSLNQLLGDRQRIQRYIDLQKSIDKDPSQFNEVVGEATSGRNAAKVRMDTQLEILKGTKDQEQELYKRGLETQMRKRGDSELRINEAKKYFDYQTSIGSDPRAAAGLASNFVGYGESSLAFGAPLGFTNTNPEVIKKNAQEIENIVAPNKQGAIKVEVSNPVVIQEKRTSAKSASSSLASP